MLTSYTKQQLIDLEIIKSDDLDNVHFRAIFFVIDEIDKDDFKVNIVVDDICYASDLKVIV